MSASKQDLRLLLQRPLDPLFTKKDDGKVSFEVPQDFLTDRYKPIGTSLATRFGEDVERTVTLRPIAHPDLSFASSLPIRGPFSLFNSRHQQIAGQLIQLFLDQPDWETLLSVAAYVKDRVNPYLYQVSGFLLCPWGMVEMMNVFSFCRLVRAVCHLATS